MKRTLCAILVFSLLLPIPSLVSDAACTAKGAIVLEAGSEYVLYEKNADLPLPQASTTKIMTALLILEREDPNRLVRISAGAACVEGSQMELRAGEEVSVRDLLYMLMLRSGNDAAVALAEACCGTQEAFVREMNEKAAALGLHETQFRNPHGLPDGGHYTTARDLARLTAAALENESFRALVSTKKVTLSYKSLTLTNSNRLLTSCPGAIGVKTGYTKAAGRCLVSAAERNGATLICVTLNDPNDWQDHQSLYDQAFSRIGTYEVCAEQALSCGVPVLGGETKALLGNTQALRYLTVDGSPLPVRVEYRTVPMLFAPVGEGTVAGRAVLVTRTGRTVASAPMAVRDGVAQKKEERTRFGSFLLHARRMVRALTSGIAS